MFEGIIEEVAFEISKEYEILKQTLGDFNNMTDEVLSEQLLISTKCSYKNQGEIPRTI